MMIFFSVFYILLLWPTQIVKKTVFVFRGVRGTTRGAVLHDLASNTALNRGGACQSGRLHQSIKANYVL